MISPAPSYRQLFLVFLRIALSGIGGVLPHARHAMVEREHWLDDQEFTEVLATGQLLPGGNIVNIAIIIGERFHGARGALCALAGLLLVPFCLFMAIGSGFGQVQHLAWLKGVFTGIGAAAAGLILSTAIRLLKAQPKRAWVWSIAALALVAIAVLKWPLVWVVLGLCALSVVLAWWFELRALPRAPGP